MRYTYTYMHERWSSEMGVRSSAHLGTKRGLGFTNARFLMRSCITADTGGKTTLVGGPLGPSPFGLPPFLLRFLGRPPRFFAVFLERPARVFVALDSGCKTGVRRRD